MIHFNLLSTTPVKGGFQSQQDVRAAAETPVSIGLAQDQFVAARPKFAGENGEALAPLDALKVRQLKETLNEQFKLPVFRLRLLELPERLEALALERRKYEAGEDGNAVAANVSPAVREAMSAYISGLIQDGESLAAKLVFSSETADVKGPKPRTGLDTLVPFAEKLAGCENYKPSDELNQVLAQAIETAPEKTESLADWW